MNQNEYESFLQDPSKYLQTAILKQGGITAREAVEQHLSTLKANRRAKPTFGLRGLIDRTKGQVIADIIHDHVEHGVRLRITAQRKDWLYFEEKVSAILFGLGYTDMFENEDFAIENQFESLRELYNDIGKTKTLESVSEPKSADGLARSVMNILLNATNWVEGKYADFHQADWQEEELKRMASSDVLRLHAGGVEEMDSKDDALRKLENALCNMPGHIGTLLTGSFAVDSRRDAFSDLDLFVICEGFPKEVVRDELLDRLALKPGFRFGGFEHLAIDGVDIHMTIFDRKHVGKSISKFESTGKQEIAMDFSSEEAIGKYSPPAYLWLSGRILSDTSDLSS